MCKRTSEQGSFVRSLVIKTITSTLLAVAVCVAAIFGGMIASLMHNMTGSSSAIALAQIGEREPEVTDTLPNDFYMLLLGVDSSESRESGAESSLYNGSFRSDTIIVAHVNLQKQAVSLCSLERDIKTVINGYEKDGYYKLNAAYAFGGVTLMKEEAEELTGLNIPYYAIIDMDGLTEIIDSFGGVEVDVEKAFFDSQLQDGIDQAGLQTLNGQQAVMYSRSRYAWDEGDFARARHQRDVLKALASKIMSTNDLFSLYSSAEAISQRVSTNLTAPQIYEIVAKMRGFDPETNMYSMMTPTTGIMEGGVSYQVLEEDLWDDMLTMFKNFEDPNAPTPQEKAEELAAAGDARYVDADQDGFYDADDNLDMVVDDKEWVSYCDANGIEPSTSSVKMGDFPAKTYSSASGSSSSAVHR